MEPEDVDGYFLANNWSQYEDELVEELIRGFSAPFSEALPDVPDETVRSRGAAWARKNAAEDLQVMQETTRRVVRNIVSEAVRDGWRTIDTVDAIRDDFIFSEKRAKLIARTETTKALGQGAKEVAVIQGQDEKRWRTVGDEDVTDECQRNEDEGWIPIGDEFPSGDETIPQHPACRCVVQYRTSEVHDDPIVQAEFRCPQCKRLLGKDVGPGSRILCRHCKMERIA